MAKVLIDIPDEIFNNIKDNKMTFILTDSYHSIIGEAITKGTPLPKGHGDLKDMNDLCYKSRYGCKGNCDYLHICNLYGAPTIIEADKEDINENN